MTDPNLKVDLIYQGEFKFEPENESPVTSMTFLGPSDILLLIKNNGTVWRIVDGNLLENQNCFLTSVWQINGKGAC